jgi:Zn-dependent peptidase ImmA (M78 family)
LLLWWRVFRKKGVEMILTPPLRARYSKINQLVARILADNLVSEPPVPIDRIIKKFGIQLKKGDLGDVSGLLVRNSNELIIGVNSTQRESRQRFTIAHEFGHFLLHDGISSHFDLDYRVNFRSAESSQATNVEEIEANYFAASLLMPEAFLNMDKAVEAIDSDYEVEKLAKKYRVSRHAMSLRLVNIYGQHRPF